MGRRIPTMTKEIPRLTPLGFAVKEGLAELPNATKLYETICGDCETCEYGIEIENPQLTMCPLCGMPKHKRRMASIGRYQYIYRCGTKVGVCSRWTASRLPAITTIIVGQDCVKAADIDSI